MTPNSNGTDSQQTKTGAPFYQPWGAGGCLWRTIVFLLGMIFISFIFGNLIKGCGDGEQLTPPVDIFDGGDDKNVYEDLPPELQDSSYVDDWNDSIPGVPELPDPEDNYIPPVDTNRVIVSPEDSVTQIVGDQLIVFFNSQDVKKDMADFAKQFKQIYPDSIHKVIYYNPAVGTMLLGVPEEELLQVADDLPKKIQGIDFLVTTNNILNGAAKPSDPGFAQANFDEYYRLIQAYDAWDITKGDSSVKVAIIDSYFDLTNPEIGERYVDRINIGTKTVNVLPPNVKVTENNMGQLAHGSHVAGLAIGGQNNQLGCSGIAPNCKWIPIALAEYPWTNLKVFEAVLYAIYHGADVINMSLGGIPDQVGKLPLGDQIQLATSVNKRTEAVWDYILKVAESRKCVICKSAGNENALMGVDFMNRNSQIVSVEAVDGKGQKADFSNFGMVPEANLQYSTVAAPGVQLWSVGPKFVINGMSNIYRRHGAKLNADANTGFVCMDGTSMAAPVVTGAVALLKSKNKELTALQIIKILKMTGKQTDTQHRIGPTIQIKDALDATGNGVEVNFDDLQNDHNLLIGKWKSTHELMIDNNGTKVDDIWTYFIFTTPTSGVIEQHTIKLGRVYTANLTVTWEKNRIVINQQGPAVSNDGNTLTKDDFICTPDQNRLLNAACTRQGQKIYDFQLEKVN